MFVDCPFAWPGEHEHFEFRFLLSSKGYGILWNNPSLTDLHPADKL